MSSPAELRNITSYNWYGTFLFYHRNDGSIFVGYIMRSHPCTSASCLFTFFRNLILYRNWNPKERTKFMSPILSLGISKLFVPLFSYIHSSLIVFLSDNMKLTTMLHSSLSIVCYSLLASDFAVNYVLSQLSSISVSKNFDLVFI